MTRESFYLLLLPPSLSLSLSLSLYLRLLCATIAQEPHDRYSGSSLLLLLAIHHPKSYQTYDVRTQISAASRLQATSNFFFRFDQLDLDL